MNWLMRILGKGKKKTAGFTLIELMVVVIVVGILAAAAIPIYRFALSRAYSSEAKATMGTMMTSMKVFAAETAAGTYPIFVFGASSDTPSILDTLGVETTTNTWWHAKPDFAAADITCVFGSTSGSTWPGGSDMTAPVATTFTGPFVWANGDAVPITGINLVYDMGADIWYTEY